MDRSSEAVESREAMDIVDVSTAVPGGVELARDYHTVGGGAIPAYQRVKLLVAARIRSGDWPEGTQIPSENQLVDILGLSRMTINRAYRELSAEGLIDRLAGIGSFVADVRSPAPLLEVRSIADDIARRGRRHRMHVLFVRREPADPVWQFFDPDGAGSLFHSRVVHYEDDLPIQLDDRFVNPVAAPRYGEQDFADTTPHRYLMEVAPLTRGEHVVEAVTATADERAALDLGPHDPCLLVRRRTWSGDRIVTAARLLHPGSRTRLEGTFTS